MVTENNVKVMGAIMDAVDFATRELGRRQHLEKVAELKAQEPRMAVVSDPEQDEVSVKFIGTETLVSLRAYKLSGGDFAFTLAVKDVCGLEHYGGNSKLSFQLDSQESEMVAASMLAAIAKLGQPPAIVLTFAEAKKLNPALTEETWATVRNGKALLIENAVSFALKS